MKTESRKMQDNSPMLWHAYKACCLLICSGTNRKLMMLADIK